MGGLLGRDEWRRSRGGWFPTAWTGQRRREWLLQSVEAEVRTALAEDLALPRRVWASLRSQASEPGRDGGLALFLLIGGYFSGLLALTVVLGAFDPTFLPEWRPLPGGGGLITTWQVQAALVAAALPFLFVLIPLVRDEALAVTRTAQVLMADTLIYPILVFGLAGTIWIGVAALWLGTDTSVWMGFLLVLLPTALGVGFAYWSASRIISNPDHVRRQSMQLWLKIIDDALVEQRSRTYANGELVDLVEARGIRKSSLLAEPEDAIRIPALREGSLLDVDKTNLAAWLDEVAQLMPDVPPAAFQTDDEALYQVSPSDERQVWWVPLLGEHLNVGDPIVLLPSWARAEVDPEELATTLDRCLKVV